MTVEERIAQLRKLMAERKMDVYYMPKEDDHLSEEYTASYFHAKSWMSGFSGDAGCTIITKDFAGLWTDGRYFTQAEGELEGSEVQLMRLRQKGVLHAWHRTSFRSCCLQYHYKTYYQRSQDEG